MGSSESTLLSSQGEDGITTVSERLEGVDPVLEKLKSLKIATPILTSEPTESSLTDILVRKPSTSSNTGIVDPKVLLELFSTYREWQEKQTQNINKRQEEIENKIEVVDALAVKLLKRYNYSVSAMKTTSNHLSGVHELQVELGELKGRLTEVMSNCDGLCKRIAAEGPDSLRSSVKPFTSADSDTTTGSVKMPPAATSTTTSVKPPAAAAVKPPASSSADLETTASFVKPPASASADSATTTTTTSRTTVKPPAAASAGLERTTDTVEPSTADLETSTRLSYTSKGEPLEPKSEL